MKRFESLNMFQQSFARKLTVNEQVIWFHLWTKANTQNVVRFSWTDLATWTGMQKRTCRNLVVKMGDAGVLKVKLGTNWKKHVAKVEPV